MTMGMALIALLASPRAARLRARGDDDVYPLAPEVGRHIGKLFTSPPAAAVAAAGLSPLRHWRTILHAVSRDSHLHEGDYVPVVG